jgi:hypothetical protein
MAADVQGDVGQAGGQGAGGCVFPDWALSDLRRIRVCESGDGTDPGTYDLNAPNGGKLQINRAMWERFFWETRGWSWEQIVLDDTINEEAACIVWERAGRTWTPWACSSVLQ